MLLAEFSDEWVSFGPTGLAKVTLAGLVVLALELVALELGGCK